MKYIFLHIGGVMVPAKSWKAPEILILFICTLFSCSNQVEERCLNRVMIVADGIESKLSIVCFNRTIDTVDGKIEYKMWYDNRSQVFNYDTSKSCKNYFLNNNALDYIKDYRIYLNHTFYKLTKCGTRNPPMDGEIHYYFLDGYGLIYQKSTTWYNSVKIVNTDKPEINELLPAIFEIIGWRDCSEQLNFERNYKSSISEVSQ